jgi:UPF0755 protein
MRIFIRILAAVLGLILSSAAAFFILNSAPGAKSTEERLFSIGKGESLSRVADRLQSEGFIRFAPLLWIVAKATGTEGSIKAGYYHVPAGKTTFEIHRLLLSGEETFERVTVPEGYSIRKIAALLESHGICSALDFVAAANSAALTEKLGVPGPSLEGYLFPDTYFLPRPFPAELLVEMMVKTFFDRLAEIEPGYDRLAPKVLFDKVTLASIVEREYRVAEEAPMIASVFENRLARNIGLESCATLEYIITEIQQKAHPEYITLEDKRIDSPYNTYKWAGLPPGPISNPGRVSLEAVFHPVKTDFLYFVLRDAAEGRHYFSKDLEEHNEAKYLYLKN